MPPAISGFPKKVPPEGDMICGVFVPGGTDIFVNFMSFARTKEVFGEDADIFRPERFLECDAREKVELTKSVDMVFGHGRWKCLGKTFVWIEMNKLFVQVSTLLDKQVHIVEEDDFLLLMLYLSSF